MRRRRLSAIASTRGPAGSSPSSWTARPPRCATRTRDSRWPSFPSALIIIPSCSAASVRTGKQFEPRIFALPLCCSRPSPFHLACSHLPHQFHLLHRLADRSRLPSQQDRCQVRAAQGHQLAGAAAGAAGRGGRVTAATTWLGKATSRLIIKKGLRVTSLGPSLF